MDILKRLKLRIEPESLPEDDVLSDIIETAKNAILARRFPYGSWPADVEERYKDLQMRIVIDLINKTGAEGEMSHSENGVSRSYESSWISEQLLQEVTPMASTLR